MAVKRDQTTFERPLKDPNEAGACEIVTHGAVAPGSAPEPELR